MPRKPDRPPRRVQQMMIDAQAIADGHDPIARYSLKREAPNKESLKAGILANQPETREDGLERIRAWYERGGALWCHEDGNEVLSTSHEHNLLAGMALHLRAALVPKVVPDVLRLTVEAWRLYTAAVRDCIYFEPAKKARGRDVNELTMQHAGARGRDMDQGRLVEEAQNSCADKVMDGLLHRNWRNASQQFDVAIPLLRQSIVAMDKLPAGPIRKELEELGGNRGFHGSLLGTDYSPLTERFGYRVLVGSWGHYSYFESILGAFSPLFGAGRVNGERVLDWTAEDAQQRVTQLNG